MKININGIHYNVKMNGTGFPLVLLHGFTGNADTWLPFFEQWGQHSAIIAVDIIGHGDTDSPDHSELYKMDRAVNDLDAMLKHLNIDKADFLGYSMGGRLALSFAVSNKDKVRKLILESASPGLKTEIEKKERRLKDHQLAEFILEEGIESFVDYWGGIPLFESQKNLSPEISTQIREQRLTNSVIGLANSLIGMGTGAQDSWWDELDTISSEVLLITGEYDKKFCNLAFEMKKRFKKCDWIEVEASGHAIHMEQKEIFGTIVSEFVKAKE